MNEVEDRIRSTHLQNERSIWIREPRSRASAENLTIFLDAEIYRDRVGVASVIDALGDEIADSWFVFVSLHSVEARWIECPCHPPFAKFIVEELLPWLKARHPELKAVRQRTLVGLSYTGLAASFVAGEHPGVFQKVISQSGSYWWNDCWLVEQFKAQPPVPTEFYLDVGNQEVPEKVQHREGVLQEVSQIEGVQRFRDALLQTGHSVTYSEFEGGHDGRSWKTALPAALKWALPKPSIVSD
jgi:enterochelin esterase-like enzyme